MPVPGPADADGQHAGPGIFARVFPRGDAASVAGAVHDAGYRLTQLNLSVLGAETLPDIGGWRDVDPVAVSMAFEHAGVEIWGLSGTYNMAHPDAEVRRAGTRRARALIARAREFGAGVVTLCTGSRSRRSMWEAHPDNASGGAWSDMMTELSLLVNQARTADVVLGIEPEPGNVVADAAAGSRLARELGDGAERLGFILDPANLLAGAAPEAHEPVLRDAFASLGERTVCVHAKDLVPWEETIAGRGRVDYRLVGELMRSLPADVPVIVQDVPATRAAEARRWLVDALADDGRRSHRATVAGTPLSRTRSIRS